MEKLRLKRDIGLFSAVSLNVGLMIGSGIFMTPQRILNLMGSPGGSLSIWAAGGVMAMLGALCYAELGTMIKDSGGEYIYLLRTFGPFPAFLYIFLTVCLLSPTSQAAIALSFAQYAVDPFYQGCSSPEIVVKCTAIVCIIVVLFINCLGVKLAVFIMNIFMASKVIALLVIAIRGVGLLINGQTVNLQNAFEGTVIGFGQIGIAFYQVLWSYGGWSNANFVTEELKNPEVNLPRAVIISVLLVTCLYILVNVSYFAAMSSNELLSSGAVAISWGNKILGKWMWLMPLSVVLSTFGAINSGTFSGGRLYYVAAREGHLPAVLSMIHVRRLTLSPAMIFTAVTATIIIITGDFSSIINYNSVCTWIFFSLTSASLLYLRIKKPDLPRPYKVPILIPILFFIMAVYLVLAPVIDSPQMEFLYIFGFMLISILFYILLVRYKLHPKFLHKVTLHLQLLLEVAPTDKYEDD
ncbi:b(0,+)-type amino acid transporter 1-like [Rhinatrema bivittatum]|uniref:b(0,+)-type amino acid transporter 1-like n=1 Tax=Rhinatrema bivittatum TaxID=194408 RepID=UPI001127CE9D|nr:b(0,+)-type amino acid transporter 1-like [Rhinatrema bivittatum]